VVTVTKDFQGITVNDVSFVHREGSVCYASLPWGPGAAATSKGCGMDSAGAKHRLVSILWDHIGATGRPLWKGPQCSDMAAFPLQVTCGPLGRPQITSGEYRGPAISFSESGGKVWAALCGDGSEIGIDVAETDEFPKEYPFSGFSIRKSLGMPWG
jgi:hypothetical protein